MSNFNEAKEKKERLDLKGAPEAPGVANLMHMLNKRYCFSPMRRQLVKTSAHIFVVP